MALTEAEMREYVSSHVDSDLQFVLEDSGVELRWQHNIALLYTSLRRFSAIGDDRAEVRSFAHSDFTIPNDTPQGRAQISAVIAAWEASKGLVAKELETRAESKVLGQPKVLQVHERQAMVRAACSGPSLR